MPVLRIGQRVRLVAAPALGEPEQEARVVTLPVRGVFTVRIPPDAEGDEGLREVSIAMVKSANSRPSQIPKERGLTHEEAVYVAQPRDGLPLAVRYRMNTSDLPCIREVIERDCYERKSKGVTVESGELWLDLGANIGAFAMFALSRGAMVTAYEPEADNLTLLRKNAPTALVVESCVTTSHDPDIAYYGPQNPNDMYRWNTRPNQRREPVGRWRNTHISQVPLMEWDGIKMDIEGAEHGILDARALPRTRKLAMEYHATKDRSMDNFHRRMRYLKERFEVVAYPPTLDRAKPGSEYEGFYDFIVHCSGGRP